MRKYFLAKDESDHWDALWDVTQLDEKLRHGRCDFLTRVFQQYFPAQGKILEAGCGLGQYVVLYREQGYDIEGVESSRVAVAKIRQHYPDLPIHLADIRQLPYPSNSIAVYFSGGVLEHFENGPGPALTEAYRVLRDDGYLLITVPYVNLARWIKDFLPFGRKDGYVLVNDFSQRASLVEGRTFYQYYFGRREILAILWEAGFLPLSTRGVQIVWGLRKMLRRQNRTHSLRPSGVSATAPDGVGRESALKTLLLREHSENRVIDALLRLLGALCGHMLLIVCRKRAL